MPAMIEITTIWAYNGNNSRGRIFGFDGGFETEGACQAEVTCKFISKNLNANDERFALAA